MHKKSMLSQNRGSSKNIPIVSKYALGTHSGECAPSFEERGINALFCSQKEQRQEHAPDIGGTSALLVPRSFFTAFGFGNKLNDSRILNKTVLKIEVIFSEIFLTLVFNQYITCLRKLCAEVNLINTKLFLKGTQKGTAVPLVRNEERPSSFFHKWNEARNALLFSWRNEERRNAFLKFEERQML